MPKHIPVVEHRDDGWYIEFFTPVAEAVRDETTGDLRVKGVAINAGTTRNQHNFPPDELKKAAKTLEGKPLLKDHKNSVDSIIGEVKKSGFSNNAVVYEAEVDAGPVADKIEKGRVKFVSVGVMVDEIEDKYDEDGEFLEVVLKGLEFVELSTVAVPADPNASIGMGFEAMIQCAVDQKRAEKTSTGSNQPTREKYTDKPLPEVSTTSPSPATQAADKNMTDNEKPTNEQPQTDAQENAQPDTAVAEALGKVSESLSTLAESQAKISERIEALESKQEDKATPTPAAAPATEGNQAEGVVEGVDEDDEEPIQEDNDEYIAIEKKHGGRVDLTLKQGYGRMLPRGTALESAAKMGVPR